METKVDEFKKLYSCDDGYNAVYNERFDEAANASIGNCIIDGGCLTLKPITISSYVKSIDIKRITTTHYPTENHAVGIYLAAPSELSIERDYDNRKHVTPYPGMHRTSGTRTMLSDGTANSGYWLSVMLTDTEPVSIIDNNTYYGYTCLLRIFFSGNKEINTLMLDTVSKYIVYVRRIRYRVTNDYANDSSGWNDLTYVDDDENTKLVTGSTYGKLLLRFPPITAGSLEIMLNTMDYDILRYRFDPKVIRTALMWDEIANMEYEYMASSYAGDNRSRDGSSRYLDRTIVDISNIDTLNDALRTVNSTLNIDKDTEIRTIDGTGAAIVDDILSSAALTDYQLTTINKNEYTIGAYSIVPSLNMYCSEGTYYSHTDGGYDTYEHAVRRIRLETDDSIPAITSIMYSIVTDSGNEYPILPEGTTIVREPVTEDPSPMGVVTITTRFHPNGDVSLYRWVDDTKVLVSTSTADVDCNVILGGIDRSGVYAIEYVPDTSYNVYTAVLASEGPDINWVSEEPVPDNYSVHLSTVPYIDYNYYNWDSKTWNYASDLIGDYSDPTVLTHDLTDGLWVLPTGVTELSFVSATKSEYYISGNFETPGTYRFIFNGTGGELNEYSYAWDIVISTPGSQTIELSYYTLILPSEGYNEALYEPVEVFIDSFKAIDQTNYREQTQDPLEEYEVCNEYRYYLFNDTILTNVDFSRYVGKRVVVKFRYLAAYVRLKIVLNSNAYAGSYYTPSVDSYKLKFMGA